ncbi:helix-turn-helix domain-containing protein [Nocardia amamiensis]|uniref:helix-turn-helix domain-containing protein n=1 Tax=Nocardia amamiensis TaxID=404578 RepID=UPI000ACBEA01|nr:helix-turn-helix transcriptional regulator [Nocardia amamiensis]
MEGSTVPRRQLGRHLRELRTGIGLTIANAAELVQWSATMLQRVEKGQVDKVRDVDIKELCRIYEAEPEQAEALVGLARQANAPEWWHAYGDLIPENFDVYVGLENSAKRLTVYQSELVPGLLQTPGYLRTLITTSRPDDSAAEVERRVQLRVKRQSLITRPVKPIEMVVVIHEAVLRRIIGSKRAMAEQIRNLIDASRRTNITLLVLPFEAGYPTGDPISPFIILEFGKDGKGRPVEPPVVYMEGFTGALYVDKPSTVQR